MREGSVGREATLLEVSLSLTGADVASLLRRAPDAPPLVTATVGQAGARLWATREEFDAAAAWFGVAARELNEPAIANALSDRAHQLKAEWRWPDHPLVDVTLDGASVAGVDYLPASASVHWYLHWIGDPCAARGSSDLPLLPLATRVPEDAEEDPAILAVVLDAAIEATATELTGRMVRLKLREG